MADLQRYISNQNALLAALSTSYLWQPETAYPAGARLVSPSMTAGLYARVTTGGVSGSSEPEWGAAGAAVTDGTVTYTMYPFDDGVRSKADTTTITATDGTATTTLTVGTAGAECSGTFTASKVYNAVYNDYAEWFPRGGDTEPGDIIAINELSDVERYVQASTTHALAVGVQSSEYAHIIGGDTPPEGETYEAYNLQKYIPVALAGRCLCKVIGRAYKGALIGVSDIPGVGKVTAPHDPYAVGILVDSDGREDVRLLRIKVR
jgi:hypothetical protein